MTALELLRRIAMRITASRRTARFTCGACERNSRCGLPPSKNCVIRAMQIARDGDYRAHPPTAVLQGVWPV
jgi:hypothetical protein